MPSKNHSRRSRQFSLTLGSTIILAFAALIFIFAFANSLFVNRRDRVNILLHSKDRITYYSISTTDEVNYIIYFRPDSKILVPGGYQRYRFGALAKLAILEKKPELLKKAYASATSSFTDFYFHSSKPEILYGSSIPEDIRYPGFSELFLYQSNANPLDRLYIWYRFLTAGRAHFTLISSPKIEEDFAKSYQGFFYNKSYRKERKLVQVIYTKKYRTADLIGRILEGNGIQVVDISYEDKPHNTCLVVENTTDFSRTAKDISKYFQCKLQKGQTGTFDILFILGDKEDYWEA